MTPSPLNAVEENKPSSQEVQPGLSTMGTKQQQPCCLNQATVVGALLFLKVTLWKAGIEGEAEGAYQQHAVWTES